MTSASVPGMHGWSNQYHPSLPGAHGSSPRHGGGLRAPFLFGRVVAGTADHMRPKGWTSSVFLRSVQHNFPTKARFLVRPRLLTHLAAPSEQEGAVVMHAVPYLALKAAERPFLVKESQDSNIFRTSITDAEGRHDVSCVFVNAWSFDAARRVATRGHAG